MKMTNAKAPEYTAVRHILTSPTVEARSAPYIGEGDFDWPGLLTEAETMSGGERALVRIAHDLWNAVPLAGIWEIPRRLDSRHFERVIEALYLYRGDVSRARALSSLEALSRAA
jgi:hypothetical protein